MKLYAIKNCDTVKKARAWLEANGHDYTFHDYKKDGVDVAALRGWCQQFGWEKVLNRAGLTWRRMEEAEKEAITTEDAAIALMEEKSSIIKRPVLVYPGGVLLGFNAAEWQESLG